MTLIVEVCGSIDNIKAGQCELDFPKSVRPGTRWLQIRCIDCRTSRMAKRCWRVRGDQFADRLNNVLQCTAIVLVILKYLSFDIGGFGLVPILPPTYGLQTSGLFMGLLKPQKTANILKAVRVDRKIDVRMDDR